MPDRALSDQVSWIDRNWAGWGPQGKHAGLISLDRIAAAASTLDEPEILERARRTRSEIQASLT